MPCTIRQNTQVSSWFQEDAGILSICDCIIKEVIEVKTAKRTTRRTIAWDQIDLFVRLN